MLKELAEVREYIQSRRRNTAMAEHLITVFQESLEVKPDLIVELGVGPGESTFALAKAASPRKATFISIDIADFSGACDYPGWLFVQADSVEFAHRFEAFCQQHGLKPQIDVLLIDTVHSYDQASKEIAAWFPFLSDHAKAMLHDTNLQLVCYTKKGSQLPKGHDIQRGVIRALESYFGKTFDEERQFVQAIGDWMVIHDPYTFGLTVCEKRTGGKEVLKELAEIRHYIRRWPSDSAMGDHLITLFEEALELQPDLIVEAGVGAGQSTFALERVAKLRKTTFISIDVLDYSRKCTYDRWFFVQDSDVAFAERFKAFCQEHGIKPQIDVLLIDALHSYGHVSKEIAVWFPLLSDHAKAIFHDTNLQLNGFIRDGSKWTQGKDIGRGVIRALEDYFGKTFDEETEFVEHIEDWTITHHPYTYGFTICTKGAL